MHPGDNIANRVLSSRSSKEERKEGTIIDKKQQAIKEKVSRVFINKLGW